jgi:hypothetical protein
MVRKGSPVRVRQRALENPLETTGFLVQDLISERATSAVWKRFGSIRPRLRLLRPAAERCPSSLVAPRLTLLAACDGDTGRLGSDPPRIDPIPVGAEA